MRVVLSTPPFVRPKRTPVVTLTPLFSEDLGLGYLAAYLRQAGHEVQLINPALQGLDAAGAAERIANLQPDLIGLSLSFETELIGGYHLLSELDRLQVPSHVIVGGYSATYLHPYLLQRYPRIDSVCLGEGEHTLLELVERLHNDQPWQDTPGLAYRAPDGKLYAQRRPVIADLDALPLPARDILSLQVQHWGPSSHVYIETSRGCFYRCTYCSVPAFYGGRGKQRWRGRSPQRVVDEIEQIIHDHGLSAFELIDDNFIGQVAAGRERAVQFADEVLRRGLQIIFAIQCRADAAADEVLMTLLMRAGLKRVLIGIESGSQTVLNRYRKGTTVEVNQHALQVVSKLGLKCAAQFIMFDPWVTVSELRETLDFIQETQAYRLAGTPFSFATMLMPYPGAPISERMFREIPMTQIPGDDYLEGSTMFYSYRCLDEGAELVRMAMRSLNERAQRDSLQVLRLLLEAKDWLVSARSTPDDGGETRVWVEDVYQRAQAWCTNVPQLMVYGLEAILTEVERDGGQHMKAHGGIKQLLDGVIARYAERYLGCPPTEFIQKAQLGLRQGEARSPTWKGREIDYALLMMEFVEQAQFALQEGKVRFQVPHAPGPGD